MLLLFNLKYTISSFSFFLSLLLSFLSWFIVVKTTWSSPILHPVNCRLNLWTQNHNCESYFGEKIMKRRNMNTKIALYANNKHATLSESFHTFFVVKSLKWNFYWWVERVCTKSRWWWVMETIRKTICLNRRWNWMASVCRKCSNVFWTTEKKETEN